MGIAGLATPFASRVNNHKLNKIFVVYLGETDYPLGDKIEAIGFRNVSRTLGGLR